MMEYGICCLDTFGPWGRQLHSINEAVYLPSIEEKINVSIAYLMELDKSDKDKLK